jgi:hypothetical protein
MGTRIWNLKIRAKMAPKLIDSPTTAEANTIPTEGHAIATDPHTIPTEGHSMASDPQNEVTSKMQIFTK